MIEKLSVSVPEEEAAWAQKRARAKKISVSAVVSEALRLARQVEARERLLAKLPPSSAQALAAVDAEWASG